MSLELAISSALTGLNVNQRALSVVSQNIANANTDGYTRKTIDQSALYLGTQQWGAGVKIDDVVRKVDMYLQRSSRIQTSVASRSEVVSDFMDRVQILLGQPGDVNTLDEYVETFFNQLQAVAQTPERTSFRETAVDSGITLARELSVIAEALEDLRVEADQEIEESVGNLNQYLASLDAINVAITNSSVLGNPISGLQDEQDILIKKITEIVDIRVLTQPATNEVYVYTTTGIALLDESAYEVSYKPLNALEDLVDNENLEPVEIYRLDRHGNRTSPPETLISGGVSADVTTEIRQGSLKAYLNLRDEILPDMLEQLDELASVLRDSMNAIHNNGSSFPGTNSLTGTRLVSPVDAYDWSGSVRIAVLDKNGKPIESPYANESHTGVRPFTLDLSTLSDGQGVGRPSVQAIIDEINDHFNPPAPKVNVGNLQNIQLVSNTDYLPSTAPPSFSFDFDLENIAAQGSDFFVTDVIVLDALGTDITNVSTTRPSMAISQYETTNGSSVVKITTSPAHGLAEGDLVYVEKPPANINGILTTDLGQFFKVSNVTATSFEITAASVATSTGVVLGTGEKTIPRYDTVSAGEKARTQTAGTITANLTGSPASAYYDIQVKVGVKASNATSVTDVTTSIVTFRVPNNSQDLLNDRYNHTAVSGGGIRQIPSDVTSYMKAMLVDEKWGGVSKRCLWEIL
jgi:flagellar hook-associated protein 1